MLNIEWNNQNNPWTETPIEEIDIELMEKMDRYWIDIRWLLEKKG